MITKNDNFEKENKQYLTERDHSIPEDDKIKENFPQIFEQFLNPETTNLVNEEIINYLPTHLSLITEDIIMRLLSLYNDEDLNEQKSLVLSNVSLLFYHILKENSEVVDSIRSFLINSEFYKLLYPTLFPYFNTPLVLMQLLHNNVDIAIYLLQNDILNTILRILTEDVDYSSIFMLLSTLSTFQSPDSDIFRDFVHSLSNLIFSSKNVDFLSQGITCLYCIIETCPEEASYVVELCTHIQEQAHENENIFKSVIYLISSSIENIKNPSLLSFCHDFVIESFKHDNEVIQIKGFDTILKAQKEFVQLFIDDSFLSFLFQIINDHANISSAIFAKALSVLCSIFIIAPSELQTAIIEQNIIEQVCNNLELLNEMSLSQPLIFLYVCLKEEYFQDSVINLIHDTGAIDTIQNIYDNEEDDQSKEIAGLIIQTIDETNEK